MSEDLVSLAQRFVIDGRFSAAQPLGRGHIHDTFLAQYDVGGEIRRFVHQRLNGHVFGDPAAVCENVARVTAHIRRKLAERSVPDAERRCLELIPGRDGRPYGIDGAGDTWRTYRYIEDTRTGDTVESAEQARMAARAFAGFVGDLADLPGPPLAVTIPRFHDLAARISQLRAAAEADDHGRRGDVARELDWAARLCDEIQGEAAAVSVATLPQRTVHNDCKLNNLLLDAATGEPLCVIDLDTVMAGTVLCDFGDLVRSGASRAAEDERDATAAVFDLDLFAGLAAGYLEGGAAWLTPEERAALPLAGPLLTYETGIRFLADHLAGDMYFRIQRPEQNLDRARAQLKLATRMLERLPALRRAVETAA